jgi:ArsR family transcriptional regulator
MKPATLDVRPVSRFFKALGDETRLRIVALLSHGELCVCHIHEALALSQPNVSRQLAILRAAGIVVDRREGTWVHYRLAQQSDPECARQLRGLVRSFAKQELLRRDIGKLLQVRGPKVCR